MKMIDDVIIIGIDSGYGNIKTANCCFPASVSAYDKEPVFKENLLVYESKFYLIGEGHKEFLADKTRDLDYYVLALAAIARELNIRKMTCGKIRIAAGLPLTWVSGQRDEFRDYLMQNRTVDFSFRSVSYHVEIVGVDVFPQGFAAVADRLSDFRGVNMICDIGNGTMNIMFINDKKPVSGNMFTEKYGTHQCLLAVRENVMRAHHTTVDEAIINRVFRFGTADIKEDFAMIDETAQRMANDGGLFQSYLDVQARFDRYSVGNAVLITAQKADATQLSDFKGWKNNGVFIKKGESGIVLLEPGEEYTKEDGTVGVSYNSKKVFDISQTTAKAKDRPAMKRDERQLLKAIIHNAPCPIEISQKLPENINAVYRPDDKKIYVRPGLEAGDIFRGISQELAHAHLDSGAYKRSDHAFTAYCVSYVLCSRYNVPKDMFRFDRLPEGFSTMDARSVRNELSKIRDVANEISSDMAKVLDKSMKPKERRDEAR